VLVADTFAKCGHLLGSLPGEPPSRKPTTGITGGCCARAASGIEAAEPARSVMNSRRLIDGPRAEDTTSNRAKTNTVEGVGREDPYVRFGSEADMCGAGANIC
jgi:hypothetical protein